MKYSHNEDIYRACTHEWNNKILYYTPRAMKTKHDIVIRVAWYVYIVKRCCCDTRCELHLPSNMHNSRIQHLLHIWMPTCDIYIWCYNMILLYVLHAVCIINFLSFFFSDLSFFLQISIFRFSHFRLPVSDSSHIGFSIRFSYFVQSFKHFSCEFSIFFYTVWYKGCGFESRLNYTYFNFCGFSNGNFVVDII